MGRGPASAEISSGLSWREDWEFVSMRCYFSDGLVMTTHVRCCTGVPYVMKLLPVRHSYLAGLVAIRAWGSAC